MPLIESIMYISWYLSGVHYNVENAVIAFYVRDVCSGFARQQSLVKVSRQVARQQMVYTLAFLFNIIEYVNSQCM